MKEIFFAVLLVMSVLLPGCTKYEKYDDSDLRNQISDINGKLEEGITVDVSDITVNSVVFSGRLVLPAGFDKEVYVVYSEDYTMRKASTVSIRIDDIAIDGRYSVTSETLCLGAKYYYTYMIADNGTCSYGEIRSFTTNNILSHAGSANCYIVTRAGEYSFAAVKGNSSEPVGAVASAEVLWESFGTDVAPQAGDLVSGVQIEGDRIAFAASDLKGNAVIAAKDASGNILWSWHIWMTDQPEDHVYINGAGTMMDRNLGATSATPDDPGVLGLFYQWGRKDPFLGSSSISENIPAKSTLDPWPQAAYSTATTGTIVYSIANPTTYIRDNLNNYDWCYSEDDSNDNTRWQSGKTIYDPCPPGYRVPDGGEDGEWSTAFGNNLPIGYGNSYRGQNFGATSKKRPVLTESVTVCWYPSAGNLTKYGLPEDVGSSGHYWSCSTDGNWASNLYIDSFNTVVPSASWHRALGLSVRCLKE